jgi:N-acetyl-alpha-D-muramate 1-phosphate uridylyltransferase
MTEGPTLPVAILAGGFATRLGALLKGAPKSMVPVAGEPFIGHQLRLLRRRDVRRVVLCLGHLGATIADYVGDGSRFGLDVGYSFDGDRPLGTGGALRRALAMLGDAFFVLYGDSYLDVPFGAVERAFAEAGAPALMTVYRNEGRWDRSNVVFDGGCILRYQKGVNDPRMRHIDYGLGVLSAGALTGPSFWEAFDLADVYGELAAEGRLAGYEVTHRFYEVGTPEGLAETDFFLRTRDGRD